MAEEVGRRSAVGIDCSGRRNSTAGRNQECREVPCELQGSEGGKMKLCECAEQLYVYCFINKRDKQIVIDHPKQLDRYYAIKHCPACGKKISAPAFNKIHQLPVLGNGRGFVIP